MNAPRTCPKRVLSSNAGGSEPLFTGMNMWSDREECMWIAFAISSLPVPVSPVIRIVERLPATCFTKSSTCSMDSLLPTLSGKA